VALKNEDGSLIEQSISQIKQFPFKLGSLLNQFDSSSLKTKFFFKTQSLKDASPAMLS
jgi:hypothetical protein